MTKVLQNDQRYIQKTRYCQVPFLYWSFLETEGPMKSLLSVPLSLLGSVSSTFFLEAVDCFFTEFLHEVTLLYHRETDKA